MPRLPLDKALAQTDLERVLAQTAPGEETQNLISTHRGMDMTASPSLIRVRGTLKAKAPPVFTGRSDGQMAV